MMALMDQLVAKAKANKQRIVLAEGTEPRTIQAADRILGDGVADIVLIGAKSEIDALVKEYNLKNIDKATIVEPENNPNAQKYADLLFKLREKKGMTREQADQLVKNPLYLGTLIIKSGEADGQVAGARNTTGDVLRPALQIIKTAPGISCVSGAFIMIMDNEAAKQYGKNGIMVFADCAVTPNPEAAQLGQIAVCAAQTAHDIAGIEQPVVGMLSFSTKGSAKHEMVDKVVEATRIAKEINPDLIIDGELQADAAIVPSVGASKAKGSAVAGHCNTLVFPSLEVGNICYKLVQRLTGGTAVGPIL
ncbi:MAG: phosphotransacetylase, partial [Bacteroidales bacterium]|nr:phosphotransacetylase [Bacteroidales bacterium]